ncbi:hypothetical protein PROFUN_00196 [Planoprotostelium fungivorum]|uniref:Uncharacterized protein n=1 Tax=Planoprotostelium fungivorum TaxID=1890364 RepID=A0A2P6P0W9_9EUKA|nr:hypothetical protein PROFUN_00196 [Planoprotostelium fungivorum]
MNRASILSSFARAPRISSTVLRRNSTQLNRALPTNNVRHIASNLKTTNKPILENPDLVYPYDVITPPQFQKFHQNEAGIAFFQDFDPEDPRSMAPDTEYIATPAEASLYLTSALAVLVTAFFISYNIPFQGDERVLPYGNLEEETRGAWAKRELR